MGKFSILKKKRGLEESKKAKSIWGNDLKRKTEK